MEVWPVACLVSEASFSTSGPCSVGRLGENTCTSPPCCSVPDLFSFIWRGGVNSQRNQGKRILICLRLYTSLSPVYEVAEPLCMDSGFNSISGNQAPEDVVAVAEPHLSSPQNTPAMVLRVLRDKGYGTPRPRGHQQCYFPFFFSFHILWGTQVVLLCIPSQPQHTAHCSPQSYLCTASPSRLSSSGNLPIPNLLVCL